MKVTVNNTDKQQEKPFPKLMIVTKQELSDNGIIVFFTKECVGFVVYTPNDYRELGYSSINYNMEYFTDFNGSITLSND